MSFHTFTLTLRPSGNRSTFLVEAIIIQLAPPGLSRRAASIVASEDRPVPRPLPYWEGNSGGLVVVVLHLVHLTIMATTITTPKRLLASQVPSPLPPKTPTF